MTGQGTTCYGGSLKVDEKELNANYLDSKIVQKKNDNLYKQNTLLLSFPLLWIPTHCKIHKNNHTRDVNSFVHL